MMNSLRLNITNKYLALVVKGHNDSKPLKRYFCSGTRLGVSSWVNKSRDIVFFENFDLKSVWAKA